MQMMKKMMMMNNHQNVKDSVSNIAHYDIEKVAYTLYASVVMLRIVEWASLTV